jgi:hypothetical protein
MSRLLALPSFFVCLSATVIPAQVEPPTLQLHLQSASIELRAEVPAGGIVAMLAALGADTVRLGTGTVLASPVVLGLAKDRRDVVVLPLAPAVAAAAGVHVQAVLLDAGGMIAPGIVLPIDRTPPPQPVLPSEPLAAVRLALEQGQGSVPAFALHAAFTAPTDGYGLRVHALVRHDHGTDVYLRLDTPGPGEGMLDIVEEHELLTKLGTDPGAKVRVLAVAAPSLVGIAARYRVLQSFPAAPPRR